MSDDPVYDMGFLSLPVETQAAIEQEAAKRRRGNAMGEPYRGGAPTVEQVDAAVRNALQVAPSYLAEGAVVDLVVNILGTAAYPNAVSIHRSVVQERLRLTGWRAPLGDPGRALLAVLAHDDETAGRILDAMSNGALLDLESAAYHLHELAVSQGAARLREGGR